MKLKRIARMMNRVESETSVFWCKIEQELEEDEVRREKEEREYLKHHC